MALENLVGPDIFIDNLVRTNPAADDPVSQGDDHLRGIKNSLLNSFPAINAAVTLTSAQLNEIPTKYAPLESPAFTGIPTAPTAAPGTNTTQLATTAFAKATADSSAIGIGQTWQNVTGGRAGVTTYTNSTGKPIQLSVNFTGVTGASVSLTINGGVVAQVSIGAMSLAANLVGIVPTGGTYAVNSPNAPILTWWELR